MNDRAGVNVNANTMTIPGRFMDVPLAVNLSDGIWRS